MNKKGDMKIIIIFFVLLFIILFVGFMMSVGTAIIDWVFDEAVPELSNLGMVDNTNMTDVATYTIAPLNTLVQHMKWLAGVLFVMMLIASVGFIMIMRVNPNKWFMAFYFMLMVILVIGAIFMSNIYEDFYDDSSELGTRLQEQTLLSWMLLYSPVVFLAIASITGIIVFSGLQTEEVF